MAEWIAELAPFRWKCFQVLMVKGENDSDETLRDMRGFEIDEDEFALFCKRQHHLRCFVPESNKAMAESYLILDEYLKFLSGANKNIKSKSIVEEAVENALKSIQWDQEAFRDRGEVYEWTKDLGSDDHVCGELACKELDW